MTWLIKKHKIDVDPDKIVDKGVQHIQNVKEDS